MKLYNNNYRRLILFGNNISHSKNKSRRKFLINIKKRFFISEILKVKYKTKISTAQIKIIKKYGGIDTYLIKTNNNILSVKSIGIKKRIIKKIKNYFDN